MAPTGDLACNPGMCPDWELNRQPFDLQPTLNPLSYASQGQKGVSLEASATELPPLHLLHTKSRSEDGETSCASKTVDAGDLFI